MDPIVLITLHEQKKSTRFENADLDRYNANSFEDTIDSVPVYTGENKREFINSLKPLKKMCKNAISEYKFAQKRGWWLDQESERGKSLKQDLASVDPNKNARAQETLNMLEVRRMAFNVAANKLWLVYEDKYVQIIEDWDRNNQGKLTENDWNSFQKNASGIRLVRGGVNKYVDK